MQTTITRTDITAALDQAEQHLTSGRIDAIEGEHHDALAEIIEARRAIEYAEQCAVTRWKQSGASWAVIGQHYGITRSAAQQRFGQ